MAIVVDTNILIAKHSLKDEKRERALEIVADIVEGVHGTPYVSDYVLAEAVNYAVGRARTSRMAFEILEDVLGASGPRWLVLLHIDEGNFAESVTFFRTTGAARGLSLTDCTSVVLAGKYRATRIASFDGGFDGLTERVG